MKIVTAILLGIILLHLSFIPFFGQDTESKEFPSPAKFNSLHKSLLMPGWGQLAEKRYVEGILFLSAELLALYGVLTNNRKGNQYYDKYRAADNVDDALEFRELTEKYDTKRNQHLLVAAGIWAVNLIDIYFIIKGRKKRENGLGLRVESGAKNLAFTLSYRF